MPEKPPRIFRSFDISLKDMRKIVKVFHSEMGKGLSGMPSSLSMIPAYVDRPSGREKDSFLALDLGGTNFRILKVELKGNGRAVISKVKRFALERRHLTGTAEELFGFLAGCVKSFLKSDNKKRIRLGFTFSFPIEQTGVNSGVLLRWTKGFNARGAMGVDVVRLLNETLTKKGVHNITVSALANDTVGTLVAKSYEDPDCDVAVILGTGTNACYSERISNIAKWHGPSTPNARMIVNIEWGNFNKLKLTKYDIQLDKMSDRPGHQILEKMVSGKYLGEIVRLMLKDMIPIAGKPRSLKTEYMSKMEADVSKDLSGVNSLLKQLGIRNSTLSERRLIKKISSVVSLRASRIAAAALAAVVTKIDPTLTRRHTIAIDGSVYEKHPNFSKSLRSALRELFGKAASKIRMSPAKDGSGKGAAIIAAMASSTKDEKEIHCS